MWIGIFIPTNNNVNILTVPTLGATLFEELETALGKAVEKLEAKIDKKDIVIRRLAPKTFLVQHKDGGPKEGILIEEIQVTYE